MATTAKPVPLPAAPYAPASPANSFAITPDNANELAQTTRYIYIGVAGDVTMKLAGDSAAVLFKAMPVGLYALAVKQVMLTGTAATDLVGLY